MHYIEFPNLGIHFELNPVLFSIGTISIHWYGLITALAFLVVLGGILKSASKFDLNQDDLIDMILITVPIGIIGARIFYVVVNWQYYSVNLSEIYKIWNGGLAIYGGIIFGIITILLFCRFRKINALHLLDHIVVYLVLGQVVGRWGNFVNQELFGPNTSLPWGMTGDIIKSTIIREGYVGVDPNLPVHPLFIYEALWNLVAFFILIWFRKRKKLNGEVFSLYMISYGGARFVIDSLRFDLKVGDLNVNRLIGICCVIVFLAIFIYRRIRMKKHALEELPYEPSQYRQIINEISEDSDEKNGNVTETGTDSDTDEDAGVSIGEDTDAGTNTDTDTDAEAEAEAETEAVDAVSEDDSDEEEQSADADVDIADETDVEADSGSEPELETEVDAVSEDDSDEEEQSADTDVDIADETEVEADSGAKPELETETVDAVSEDDSDEKEQSADTDVDIADETEVEADSGSKPESESESDNSDS